MKQIILTQTLVLKYFPFQIYSYLNISLKYQNLYSELNLLNQKLYESIRKQKYLTVLNHKDTHLYVDPLSEMYLLGTTIDYIHEDYSKGQFESKFNFDINKDLMSSCGCGISFSPK